MTWAEKVKERDGWKCQGCGRTDRLQAHHIKPIFLYPELRNDIDNGITLCKACHQDFHGGSFVSGKLKEANGKKPDPEGRYAGHKEKLDKERDERTEARKGGYVTWHSNKNNGHLVVKAALAAGRDPTRYIAEAISMRMKAEGFDHDEEIFIPSYRAWEDESFIRRKTLEKNA